MHISSYSDAYWKMNDITGNIGIICIDNTKEKSIAFVHGNQINNDKIKVSSRSLTKVSGLPEDIDIDVFINECNSILGEYRNKTNDVFLTSFKGLRDDGCYRRRLDFRTAKNIMNLAVERILQRREKA